jgi:cell division protein FtsB
VAIVGARPVGGIGLLGRRTRVRAQPARPVRRRSGAGRRRREMTGASGLLAIIAAGALLALFYLSQSAHVAATGYEINSLEQRVAELRADQQQLIYRIAEARSPAVIERVARGRLQLRPLPVESVTFADAPATDRRSTKPTN